MSRWAEDLVAVVGAGTIGVSVAHAVARAGTKVVLHDIDPKARARALDAVHKLEQLATLRSGRRKLAEITVVSDLAELSGSALVVENVVEDVPTKVAVHAALGRVLDPTVLVAVNTSAVPIGRLAAALGHPERVVGVHFMNPVILIDTVELVRPAATGETEFREIVGFLEHMGIKPVAVKDNAGFVVNRSLMLLVNEAIATLADGVAEARQVDQLFRGCLGHKSGPLQTADLIGLDTVRDTLLVLQEEYGERFAPTALLERLVAEGRLGRKTGVGIYDYVTHGGVRG